MFFARMPVTEATTMDPTQEPTDQLLRLAAQQLTGHHRRLFQARACLDLCGGNTRRAERRFGWGRHTVAKGLHELQSGVISPDEPFSRVLPIQKIGRIGNDRPRIWNRAP